MSYPLPIPDTYWVKPGQFLVGEYPGGYDEPTVQKRINALLEAGITTFIDLTEPNELTPYEPILRDMAYIHGAKVNYKRLPIPDFGLPKRKTMISILDEIDAALDAGRKVYLHCRGGIGRTGTTVGCYLVRHGMIPEDALQQIAEWWRRVPKSIYHPRSPETQEQFLYVLRWQERALKKK